MRKSLNRKNAAEGGTAVSEKKTKRAHEPGRNTLLAMMVFFFLAFFLLALKDGLWQSFALSVVVPAIIYIGTAGISHLFPSDRLLLSLTNFLCALGVLVILISLITSISFHAVSGTLFTYILMFGMVAAGAALLIKVLFKPNNKKSDD